MGVASNAVLTNGRVVVRIVAKSLSVLAVVCAVACQSPVVSSDGPSEAERRSQVKETSQKAESDPDPRIVATAGWTTRQLERGIGRVSPDNDYDLVLLLIGANNAFGGESAESFRPDFVGLLERAVQFAGGAAQRVVVMTLPDHSVTPAGRRHGAERAHRRVTAYNRVIRQETEAAGARLVDLAPVSRRAEERPELVADDGLHPAAKMHALWTDELTPVVLEALGG